MNLFSKTAPKLFNILSIGQRGVGKTVFMAGSYAQLQANQERQGQLWFECSDTEGQKNLEGILNYIAANKQYPPPTIKITDFNFDLKHRDRWGTKTLCQFRWWDIPGEVCRIEHPDFQQMVLNSHSCCILINADALASDSAYLQNLEGIIKQVVAIASLVDQHRLDYKFALVFTQCDRLGSDFLSQIQIEENLQPLISRLDQAKAKYQKFYSSIPIVQEQERAVLRGSGAAEALLWLLLEKRSARLQQDLGSGLAQKKTELALPGGRRRNAFLLLAGSSLLGAIAFLFFGFGLVTQRLELVQDSEAQVRKYQKVLEVDPNNVSALVDLSNLYLERGDVNQAISIMEKIVQQNPENLYWHLNLAKLYERTNQKTKAEDAYDRVLAQHENNFVALISKAILRSEQGDRGTAESLFTRAEQAAETEDLKAKVRALAQSTLTPVAQ